MPADTASDRGHPARSAGTSSFRKTKSAKITEQDGPGLRPGTRAMSAVSVRRGNLKGMDFKNGEGPVEFPVDGPFSPPKLDNDSMIEHSQFIVPDAELEERLRLLRGAFAEGIDMGPRDNQIRALGIYLERSIEALRAELERISEFYIDGNSWNINYLVNLAAAAKNYRGGTGR